jgi:hypothetical protein
VSTSLAGSQHDQGWIVEASSLLQPRIEDTVVKFLKDHFAVKQDKSTSSALCFADHGTIPQLIAGIVV